MNDTSSSIHRMTTSKGRVFFGASPEIEDLHEIKKLGIQMIWNLASEMSFVADIEKNFVNEVLTAKILDYSAPDDAEMFMSQLDHVVEVLRDGGSVYVHCLAGHGRTGMGLAAILMRLECLAPDVAMTMTKQLCHGPEKDVQVEFVRSLSHKNSKCVNA